MAAETLDVDAVTFDFWDTLVATRPRRNRERRVEAWSRLLAASERRPTREEVEAALDFALAEYRRAWAANEQFGAGDCVRIGLEQLRIGEDEVEAEAMLEATVEVGDDFELAPGTVGMLDALGEAGLRLGIICDVGFTSSDRLRGHLQSHGVLDRFDHWSFSDEVGFYKPAPEIFAHALSGLGVADPGRGAHVGDLRRTDVAGAREFGMRSVRYAGLNDDRGEGPEAEVVVSDHGETTAVLGAGR